MEKYNLAGCYVKCGLKYGIILYHNPITSYCSVLYEDGEDVDYSGDLSLSKNGVEILEKYMGDKYKKWYKGDWSETDVLEEFKSFNFKIARNRMRKQKLQKINASGR